MEPVEETGSDNLKSERKQTKALGKDEITPHSETNHVAEKSGRLEPGAEDNHGADKKELTHSKTRDKHQEINNTWKINKNKNKTKHNDGQNT
eukprot:4537637-Ditylum_brightwellii.AAC.1